jgi:hypothetical protein
MAHWLSTAPRQTGGGDEPYAVAVRSTRAQHEARAFVGVSLASAKYRLDEILAERVLCYNRSNMFMRH